MQNPDDSPIFARFVELLSGMSFRPYSCSYSPKSKNGVFIQSKHVDLLHKFVSQAIPPVSISEYLKRLYKLYFLTDELLIASLVYLEKILDKTIIGRISIYEIHRLIPTLFMLSIKYHCDNYYTNEYYARMAGMSLKEINELEDELFYLLEYRLEVTEETYNTYEEAVIGLDEISDNKNISIHQSEDTVERMEQ